MAPLIPKAPRSWKVERAREDDERARIIRIARTEGYRVFGVRPTLTRMVHTEDGRSRPVVTSPILGDPGWPDLVLAHPSVGLIFVELKRAPNKPHPDQLAWASTLDAAGAEWRLVWVPEQTSDFIRELRARAKQPTRHAPRRGGLVCTCPTPSVSMVPECQDCFLLRPDWAGL